jgi:hypothetical protein
MKVILFSQQFERLVLILLMASSGMMYTANSIKIGSSVKTLLRGLNMETHTHTHTARRCHKPILFFESKGSELNMKLSLVIE